MIINAIELDFDGTCFYFNFSLFEGFRNSDQYLLYALSMSCLHLCSRGKETSILYGTASAKWDCINMVYSL